MERIDHLRDWITKKQDQAFVKQAEYYNRGRRDITFNVGNLVKKIAHFLFKKDQHVSSKLVKPFQVPYVIRVH